MLLDQEGLEIDNFDRLEKDTPLHKAVRYANEIGPDRSDEGLRVVDILLDAGCDPRYVCPMLSTGKGARLTSTWQNTEQGQAETD